MRDVDGQCAFPWCLVLIPLLAAADRRTAGAWLGRARSGADAIDADRRGDRRSVSGGARRDGVRACTAQSIPSAFVATWYALAIALCAAIGCVARRAKSPALVSVTGLRLRRRIHAQPFNEAVPCSTASAAGRPFAISVFAAHRVPGLASGSNSPTTRTRRKSSAALMAGPAHSVCGGLVRAHRPVQPIRDRQQRNLPPRHC